MLTEAETALWIRWLVSLISDLSISSSRTNAPRARFELLVKGLGVVRAHVRAPRA